VAQAVVDLPAPIQEDIKMQKAPFIIALGLMLPAIGTLAHAQTPPATPPQQELAPTNPKLNLTLEQRYTIKEIIKDAKSDGAPANVPAAIGEPIPQGISPQPMPSAVAQKVPQVKAHRYYLTSEQVVIVDPKDNKVVEVIKLQGE
jgi:hypothetical protein